MNVDSQTLIVFLSCRLFFLHEGSDRHREIITLRDIRSLEKVSMTSFLVPVPALKVSWKGWTFRISVFFSLLDVFIYTDPSR